MKKIVTNLFLLLFTLVLLVPESSAQAAEGTEQNNLEEVKPFMKVYDKNGNLIESYDENEMQQFYVTNTTNELYSQLLAANIHDYFATSLNTNIYIDGGTRFKNPYSITINPVSKFKSLIIEINGPEKSSVEVGGFVGGLSVPLWNKTLASGNYSVRFIHGAPGPGAPTIQLKAGQLWYQ